tara:strand:- start:583 stop:888 length:306 start_codon:yes stop_codon:yes gene_type:complete
MWKKQIVDLGKVKVGKPVDVKFEYLSEGEYSSSSTSCGCTVANWKSDTKVLQTVYTPNKVAQHLKDAGQRYYNSIKYINVVMNEEGKIGRYELQIRAVVHD